MNAPQTTIKAIIVECGRENSIEAETFGVIDERSQSNARWTTQTAIDIEPGDTIIWNMRLFIKLEVIVKRQWK